MTDPGAASADGQALAYLRSADPVLARVIDAHAGFDPRGWLRELPAMDTFGALIFMVTGQQLSVLSAARILGRVQDLFGGRLPSPAALLAADPGELLKTGLSRRKVATLRTVAAKFAVFVPPRPLPACCGDRGSSAAISAALDPQSVRLGDERRGRTGETGRSAAP